MTKKLALFLASILLHVSYLFLKLLRFTKREDLEIPKDFKLEEKKVGDERLFIIDDDIGMNRDGVWNDGHYWLKFVKITDPDGGLELIYALREPKVRILGVTIMMGVANTDVCVQAAKNIVNVLGIKHVPILKGAESHRDLGKETEASRFIVEMCKKYPGRVEIIATGPLTNIATALMMEPKLPEYWHTLHFATGEFRGKLGVMSDLYLPILFGVQELNTNVDYKATEYVLKHGGSFPIYPNEVMDDVIVSGTDYKLIKSSKSNLAKFLAYEMKITNLVFSHFIPFRRGLVTHGTIPTAMALDPSYKSETIESAVEMRGYGYQGYTFVLSDNPNLSKHKIHIRLDKASKERMHQTLINRLL
jgi:inosine-uridine nucleoside N-ribohydrolase